jgi:hypothetical protein
VEREPSLTPLTGKASRLRIITMSPAAAAENSTSPLADFFWIAGVDGSEILETFLKLGDEYNARGASAPGPAVADTIQEDAEPEDEQSLTSEAPYDSNGNKRDSSKRLSRLSNEARLSMWSVESKGTNSNRSSMTIKAAPSPSRSPTPSADFDFDKALFKFASERESFLSDLSLSAGAITPARPKPRPRTQKIVAEDKPASTNPLKSGIGSVRRHMSFREMSSMKRQPSIARQGELRLTANWFIQSEPPLANLSPHSLDSNCQTSQQLQFCDSCSSTSRSVTNNASLKAEV